MRLFTSAKGITKGKRDANESEITKALDKLGATYIKTDEFDIIAEYRGATILLEVKTEKGKLTKSQAGYAKMFKSYFVVRSARDVIDVLRAVKLDKESRKKITLYRANRNY